MSHRYKSADDGGALDEVSTDRCVHCGVRRRLVGVLVAGWNTLGNAARQFPVSRTLHLYQRHPRGAWSTESPKCMR